MPKLKLKLNYIISVGLLIILASITAYYLYEKERNFEQSVRNIAFEMFYSQIQNVSSRIEELEESISDIKGYSGYSSISDIETEVNTLKSSIRDLESSMYDVERDVTNIDSEVNGIGGLEYRVDSLESKFRRLY